MNSFLLSVSFFVLQILVGSSAVRTGTSDYTALWAGFGPGRRAFFLCRQHTKKRHKKATVKIAHNSETAPFTTTSRRPLPKTSREGKLWKKENEKMIVQTPSPTDSSTSSPIVPRPLESATILVRARGFDGSLEKPMSLFFPFPLPAI